MDDNLIEYQVKPGDTLERVAAQTGMTREQLKDFHNRNCGKMDKVWFNDLLGIRTLIIPKSYKSEEQILAEQLPERPSHYPDKKFYAAVYTVSESCMQNTGPETSIRYTADLEPAESAPNAPGSLLISVRCHSHTKDGTAPDDKMSTVALACMDRISPVPLIIASPGARQISEPEELLTKFSDSRAELEAYFNGEIFARYFDLFSANLADTERLNHLFLNKPLSRLLFPDRKWFYRKEPWNESFHFVPNSFPVSCQMHASYDHSDEETVTTTLSGSIQDSISLEEILRGQRLPDPAETPVEGTISILYRTHKHSGKLFSAELTTELYHEGELYRRHRVQTEKMQSNE